VLSNPTLSPADFYEILAHRFGLPDASSSKGRFLLAFERDLLERYRAGGLTAVIVDEAQSLTHELFEEIRLLANLETATAKLVNVVLVGQPELADRLNDPSLRQLKQRIVLRCTMVPLDLESTASYIATRLQVAGASPSEVFTKDAVVSIHEASRGIPRIIGVICENALLAGYAAQRKPVDQSVVAEVCRDLDLPADGRPPREDEVLPEEDVDVAERTAPADSKLRRVASRFLPHPRIGRTQPEPAEKDSEAPVLEDRSRMFRFR
jgi:type II secretory pathway predicted ATPase ExeA